MTKKRSGIPSYTLRRLVFERDNFTCIWCGMKHPSSYLICDHIIPIAIGGKEFDMDNVQTLCKRCDKLKTRADMKIIRRHKRLEKQIGCDIELLADNIPKKAILENYNA